MPNYSPRASARPSLWSRLTGEVRDAMKEVVDYLQPPCLASFRAYRNAALTLSGTANQPIVFDVVEFDLENEYDFNTGYWIPKHLGIYLVTAGVALNTNQTDGSTLELRLNKNGNRERYFHFYSPGSTMAPQMNSADVVWVTNPDSYQIAVSVNATSTHILTGTNATWFSATLLRRLD